MSKRRFLNYNSKRKIQSHPTGKHNKANDIFIKQPEQAWEAQLGVISKLIEEI